MIKALADSYGVGIAEAELVGPVPLAALEEVIRHSLRVRNFNMEQIIETHLLG
jgi:glutamate formiminotransferase